MGGGKTKTYRNFDTGEVFDPETNLFSKDIVKYAGAFKERGLPLGKSLIESISAFTNIKYLEKLDAVGTAEGTKREINEDALKLHFNIAEPGKILYATTRTSDGRELPGYLIKNIETLDSNGVLQKTITYNATVSPTGQFGIESLYTGPANVNLSVNVYNIDVYTDEISVDAETGEEERIPTIREGVLALTTYNGWESPLFTENLDGTIQYRYSYTEDYVYTYQVEVCTTSGTPPVTTCTTETRYAVGQRTATHYVNKPRMERQIIVAVTTDSYHETFSGETGFEAEIGNIVVSTAYDTDIVRDTTGYKYLIMHFKKDGEFVETKEMTALYNNFGIKKGDLYDVDGEGNEGLGNPDLKHVAFTYAGKRTIDSKYGEMAIDHDLSYRFLGIGKGDLTINSPELSFKYMNRLKFASGEDELALISSVEVNGNSFDAPLDGNIYLIPINKLSTLPLKLRYEFVVAHFRLAFLSIVTVKLKWYQTGLFKFVAIIAIAVISYFTGLAAAKLSGTILGASTATVGVALAYAGGALGVLSVMGVNTGLVGQVIGMISIMFSGYIGLLKKGLEGTLILAKALVDTVSMANSLIIAKNTKGLSKELASATSDREEAEKELDEELKNLQNPLMLPFTDPLNEIDNYYAIATGELQYDYDVLYNYDIIFSKNQII